MLPWINRVGGVLIVVFGLYLWERSRLRECSKESAACTLPPSPPAWPVPCWPGVVFGAGWTPCIGPILATILLLASMEESAMRGGALLGVYGLGLALPFLATAYSINWYIAGSGRVRSWLGPLQKVAGAVLVVVGSPA